MTTATTKTQPCHDTTIIESKPSRTKSSPITITREQVDEISAGIRAVQKAVDALTDSWTEITEVSGHVVDPKQRKASGNFRMQAESER